MSPGFNWIVQLEMFSKCIGYSAIADASLVLLCPVLATHATLSIMPCN